MRLSTSASVSKDVENFSGSHFIKVLFSSPSHSERCQQHHKAPSLQCWLNSTEQVKISYSQVRRTWGMLQCCHNILCQEILDQNRPVCCSIVVKDKPTVRSLFFGVYPPDRMPKATTDVNVHLFINTFAISISQNFFNILSANSGNFSKLQLTRRHVADWLNGQYVHLTETATFVNR